MRYSGVPCDDHMVLTNHSTNSTTLSGNIAVASGDINILAAQAVIPFLDQVVFYTNTTIAPTNTGSPVPNHFSFFTLPGEVRNQVYAILFS